MFTTILYILLIVMSLTLVLCFIRTIIGPTTPDRILALDAFSVNLIGFIGILMILQESVAYSDVVLVLAILSFIGTISLSKFLERGAVFDRD